MVRGVGIVVLVGLARAASAQELANDSFVDGGNAAFQAGFVSGEMAASRLTPPTAGAYRLTGVKFLFGGAANTEMISLHVYTDTAGTDAPGGEIFTMDYMLTASDSAFQM